MPQGSTPTPLLVFLLATLGYAMAGLHLWPSVHVALSNSSVFLDYDTADGNASSDIRNMTLTLVDTETNATLLTRTLPANQSEGRLELNCSCFLYAGTFRFRLEQIDYATANSNANANASVTDRDGNGVVTTTATWWWSSELRVEWPTFHIAVDRASNQSGSFQVGISTNELFQPCSSGLGPALFLEVSYLEFNQIGRNSIDKVRARTRHPIKELRSQTVDLSCAFHFTERDFIRVALRSPHTNQDVKSSGPLYLSRIFSYKLLVDNINSYRSGCEGTVSVRLVTPPCALINGKVLLFRDGGVGSEGKGGTGVWGAGGGVEGGVGAEGPLPSVPLAFNWLTQGENETEFNCSVFDPGRNKYCFRFVLNFSRSPSPAQTCLVVHRNAESWGVWQAWSVCSVSCGEGVRERVRECLLPSGGGSMQCTGMVKEQSLCSLEDCTVHPAPSPSLPPPPASSFLGGNLVVVAGISLCLAVILATILVTLWRKLCRTPQCNSVRSGSMHSPGGRKLSDEASICGNSLQRPSLSDSQGNHGGTGPGLAQNERPNPGCKPLPQPPPLVIPLDQDPDRLSPSGQKVLPPIFGYRLAQQQLKEMKKRGLKEATQLYHVSQSPVHDTLLEDSPTSTPTQPGFTFPGLSPNPSPLDLQEEDSNLSRFRITAPFPEPRVPQRSSVTLPDRLSPRVELVLGPPVAGYMREGGGGGGGSSKRRDRTADWVEMVERTGLGGMGGGGVPSNSYQKNPNCRRTSSFHVTKPPPPPAAPCRPHRERSQTQVGPRTRTLPEGSCRIRGTSETQNPAYPPYPIPEQSTPDWARPKPRPLWPGDDRRRPWVETGCPPCFSNKPKHAENNTTYLISDPEHTETNTTTAAMLGSELLSNPELTLERERRRIGDRREGGEDRGERGGTSGIGGPGVGSRGCTAYLTPDRAERAEHNWNRRGPSPIQRNILARKLREAQSCNTASDQQGRHNPQQQRQRSSTFSVSASEQRKGRCRSLPLSGDSPYGLTEAEQCMLDLDMTSLYLGEDEF
ncbi:thrombospondin type-1 domain-containing protein 1 [Salvelinus fontinalis]|uniref:thrombospondin type-1 domain-containing protein 1 n=1 Tax=Salvelinus fontinalis TaxID=8038 RepID=UPI0024858E64|nr:thrombospondin type-1 domain-containing protein 1 [Salvelinus fontinalis]